MDPEWARQDMRDDVDRAVDLCRAAVKARAAGWYVSGSEKISDGVAGASQELETHSRAVLESALSVLQHRPYFRRVTVEFINGCVEPYCVTEVRSIASIIPHVEGDYTPLGWTSPMAAGLPQHMGGVVRGAPRGQGRIVSQARYADRVLREPTEGKLEGPQGSHEFVRPVQVDSSALPVSSQSAGSAKSAQHDGEGKPARPEVPASKSVARNRLGARDQAGLVNIAAVADEFQWNTFHRDITRNVVVEGPPGSGKTSVALMRIPCLIDRQWSDLGLRDGVDSPRYTERRSVVVIANPALRSTIEGLVATLELRTVRARDLEQLLSEQLGQTMLKPVGMRPATPGEQLLAARGEFLAILEAGLYRHSLDVAARLGEIEEVGRLPGITVTSLQNAIRRWAAMLKAKNRRPFAGTIGAWISEQQGARRMQAPGVAEAVRVVAQRLFHRQSILRKGIAMASSDQLGTSRQAILEWQTAFERSPLDASLGEWCAFGSIRSVWYSNDSSSALPSFLRAPEPPTHIVVDEAQDLGLTAFEFLRAWLAPGGVMTLAGDPAQSERVGAPSSGWCGLPTSDFDRIALGVNYRQSREIGGYVRSLHRGLFAREASWKVGARPSGQPVRLRRITTPTSAGIEVAVIGEIRRFEHNLPGDSLAVIHQGEASLTDQLVSALSKLGTGEVRAARDIAHKGLASLVVGNAWELRGLEFGAVLVLDRACSGCHDSELDSVSRHGLYVAVSRACNALTVLASHQESGEALFAAGAALGLNAL